MAKINLEDVANMAEQGTIKLSEANVAAPTKQEENKTARRMVNLRPSEYEAFIAMIGRQSFSEAVHELILEKIQSSQK